MRKTEDFRPENRGAYRREYRRVHRENSSTIEAGSTGHENICRELSGEGQRFCAAAGLLEEIIVLAAFGIRVSLSPLPVLAFLWVLFAILTAAALIGASWLADCLAGLRPDPQCTPEHGCAKAAPAPRTALSRRCGCGTERVAA